MAHMTVARIESQTINRRAMTARTKLLTICASFVLSIAGLAPVSAARQMQHGAEIYFQKPSGWQAYGGAIALIIGIIVVQAGLISRLLYEQRRSRYAEAQSRQRISELARANRISTVGELTASIAHEINQPLGAIRTNAETMELMLKSSSPDIDEIREIVADIRQDENRATEVIRRLRSLLRKAPFELREIDLNEVVRETIAIALTVGRPVELRSSLTAVPLPIRGDHIQLQQVILNLMMNAMDAMANLPSAERKLTVATAGAGNFAEISVSDAGPGIAPDKLKQIFEPFFTTKAQGMGIGLSIARTIVEAHNGQIFAENQTDGGAIFRMQLPLSQR
jgi:C4-dicarboxylate-specific signal transduction histidine kinase